jgi:hypothetical protein
VSWAVGLLFDMLLALANDPSTDSLTFFGDSIDGQGQQLAQERQEEHEAEAR